MQLSMLKQLRSLKLISEAEYQLVEKKMCIRDRQRRTVKADYRAVGTGRCGNIHIRKIYGISEHNGKVP